MATAHAWHAWHAWHTAMSHDSDQKKGQCHVVHEKQKAVSVQCKA